MNIQRMIPPAAAPLNWKSLLHGFAGMFFSQKYSRKLERSLAGYLEVKHVFLLSSGKAALTVILKALQSIAPGKRKVLVPAYTCFSVPSAIVKAGLDVSACDISSSTFDFNNQELAGAIDHDTLCIVSTHLFGIPADPDAARSLSVGKKVFVVEDAAQAMGVLHKGKPLGTFGDIGFFSLSRGKNVTCGSGGIIFTNNDKIAEEVAQQYAKLGSPGLGRKVLDFFTAVFLFFFLRPSLYRLPAGLPFLRLGETIFDSTFPIAKMSGVKAGLMIDWQKRLEKANSVRYDNTIFYQSRISTISTQNLAFPCIRFPYQVDSAQIKERIVADKEAKKLGISRMYPAPINEIEELRGVFHGMTFPQAKKCADHLVTLPTHELLSSDYRKRIVEYIKNQESVASMQGQKRELGNIRQIESKCK